MEAIFGTLTMILAVTMAVFALPTQIRKNYKEKRCGNSLSMMILPLLVYGSRIGYCVSTESWYILIGDVLGLIFVGITLAQFFYYRRRERHN